MYVRHFIQMLLGLVFMGIIGVSGLVLASYYSKSQETPPAAAAPAPLPFTAN